MTPIVSLTSHLCRLLFNLLLLPEGMQEEDKPAAEEEEEDPEHGMTFFFFFKRAALLGILCVVRFCICSSSVPVGSSCNRLTLTVFRQSQGAVIFPLWFT